MLTGPRASVGVRKTIRQRTTHVAYALNSNPLDLIERDLVARPVVKLGGPWAFVAAAAMPNLHTYDHKRQPRDLSLQHRRGYTSSCC